jgi:phosphoadenylyl-sulfate reductase (thioredoxin)
VLKQTVASFQRPAFPCALIAGDVVLLRLLHRLGYLSSGQVKVIFIDTLHLFPETLAFMARCEAAYGFKVHTFHADGFPSRAAFDAKFGPEFWRADIEEYDRLCKVEPFARALKSLAVDCMLNGRRRDHGFERAHLEVFEAGSPVKAQPLAYWEFADCFAYLERHGVEAHPLHAAGYPSIGDAHSTVPVPKDKWFEYAGERSGRFQGLTTKDGKPKTECGIHVDGSTRTFDRDLWPVDTGVVELSVEQYQAGALGGGDALLVVYAPWCPFCQKMEAQLARLAAVAPGLGLKVAKLRGDTVREFVRANLATQSFPTLLAFPKAGGGKQFVKHATEERSAEDLLAFVNAACGSKRALPAGA